ncbi:hypothetical protein NKJ51_15790 [Mesorhizobium sp. M0134]|uniref:hypothetical protein n=1 Tax=Mesorhizobium sp. M0134 TaxID=2956889 RepID=UPI003335BB6D
MKLLSLIIQPLSAFREFVATRYRPELYYMRGPGPASRRMVTVDARRAMPRRCGG